MTESQDTAARLADCEARIQELEMVQKLLLRLMSMSRPLAGVLEQYGATKTQEEACLKLLDDLSTRAAGPERDRPSFPHFELHLTEIFPEYRGDRQFVQLLIDTLKVERAAYRKLHDYMVERGWPSWTERSSR